MTRPTYDLTREPWIACEALDGRRVLLGFEDVLLRAHELRAIHDESPLVTAVVHRLVLACVHRIVDGPRSAEAWAVVWRQPRFDPERVRAYFERWRHRFDLFHPDRPFLQVGGLHGRLAAAKAGKPPSLVAARRLAMEASSYSGAVNLLEHGGEDERSSPAEAVRAMLTVIGFGAGGRIANTSDSAGACPLRPGSIALALGKSLRETLVLNLLILRKDRPVPDSGQDRPAWESESAAGYGERTPLGWLDALTWQARRVELQLDGDLVSSAVIAGGEDAPSWSEPMHALDVRDEKKGPMAIKFLPNRAGFRDAMALYQSLNVDARARRPMVCSQIAELVSEEHLPGSAALRLVLLGVSSDQANIRMSRAEELPLPPRLLADTVRLDALRAALEIGEKVEGALGRADYRLASCALDMGNRGPDKNDVRALVDRLDDRTFYWNRLATGFPPLVAGITSGNAEEASAAFVELARRAARAALKSAADQIGDGARAHRARALAERTLANELEKIFPSPSIQGAEP